jgi:hypothetical protein
MRGCVRPYCFCGFMYVSYTLAGATCWSADSGGKQLMSRLLFPPVFTPTDCFDTNFFAAAFFATSFFLAAVRFTATSLPRIFVPHSQRSSSNRHSVVPCRCFARHQFCCPPFLHRLCESTPASIRKGKLSFRRCRRGRALCRGRRRPSTFATLRINTG